MKEGDSANNPTTLVVDLNKLVPEFPDISECDKLAGDIFVLKDNIIKQTITKSNQLRPMTYARLLLEQLTGSATLLKQGFRKQYEQIRPTVEPFQTTDIIDIQEEKVLDWISHSGLTTDIMDEFISITKNMYSELRLLLTAVPYRIQTMEDIMQEVQSLADGDLVGNEFYDEMPRPMKFDDLRTRFYGAKGDILAALNNFSLLQKRYLPHLKAQVINTVVSFELFEVMFKRIGIEEAPLTKTRET